MEVNGADETEESMLIVKRMPIISVFSKALSAKTREISQSLLADKKLLKDIKPPFRFQKFFKVGF